LNYAGSVILNALKNVQFQILTFKIRYFTLLNQVGNVTTTDPFPGCHKFNLSKNENLKNKGQQEL